MSSPRLQRGYTIVELMMAIAVFAIGVSGIIALQKVTIESNRHAKNLAVATHIGQSWVDALQADAATWNLPSQLNPGAPSDLNQTVWLQEVDNTAAWFQPDWEPTRLMGPGFDALGNPTNDPDEQVFCSHLRLSWLNPDDQGVVGNGLIRVEVRVFWLRERQTSTGGNLSDNPFCSPQDDAVAIGQSEAAGGRAERFHFVHQVTAIRQNGASR